MKKLLLAIGVLTILGAGCAQNGSSIQPTPTPSPTAQIEPTPVPTMPTTDVPASPSNSTGLQELPSITPPAVAIDNNTWVTTTTRAGLTVTAPVKGTFAPTWAFSILAKDDARLKGNCYVAEGVIYQKTAFPDFEQSCQTTTSFTTEAGTRTDYFTIVNDSNIYLLTFTKAHGAKFNMNDYSATVDHVISLID